MRSPAFRIGREKFGIDRNDPSLALFAPLWYTGLQGSPFTSLDLNRRVCTVTGATWGLQGRAFAADDKIVIPSFLTNTTEFTIGFWYKHTAHEYHGILGLRDATSRHDGIEYAATSDRLYFYVSEAGVPLAPSMYKSTTIFDDGLFHFITIYSPGGASSNLTLGTFGLDGVVSAPTDFSDGTPTGTWNTFSLGYQNGVYLNGTVGDVFVWLRKLTAAEDMRIYRATQRRFR